MLKITLKKLKTFPSREWGENGGTSCDVYVNNKLQGEYFQEGNGGTYSFYSSEKATVSEQEINEAINEYLRKPFPRAFYNTDLFFRHGYEPKFDLDDFVAFSVLKKSALKNIRKFVKEGSVSFLLRIDNRCELNDFKVYKSPYPDCEFPLRNTALNADKKEENKDKISYWYFEGVEGFENLFNREDEQYGTLYRN